VAASKTRAPLTHPPRHHLDTRAAPRTTRISGATHAAQSRCELPATSAKVSVYVGRASATRSGGSDGSVGAGSLVRRHLGGGRRGGPPGALRAHRPSPPRPQPTPRLPQMNDGDQSWVLTSIALVNVMTPGEAARPWPSPPPPPRASSLPPANATRRLPRHPYRHPKAYEHDLPYRSAGGVSASRAQFCRCGARPRQLTQGYLPTPLSPPTGHRFAGVAFFYVSAKPACPTPTAMTTWD
jgi:hypothetical protein